MVMVIRRTAAAAGVAALLLLGTGTAAFAAPSSQDSSYLKAAHQGNLAEIAGGQLAQQKASSQEVKDLGARFVADHTKLDAALQSTASALNVTLPSAPNPQQQALAARYRAASGSAFDTLFVSTQTDAHMGAMQLGQTEIAQGSDPQVKKAAQSAAPVIAAHQRLLSEAARALGIPTSIGTGTGGDAARRDTAGAAPGLVVLGVLLVVAAALTLRRRTRVAAE
jgi:putative membrane protein